MKKLILLSTAIFFVLPLSAQFQAKMFFTGMGKEHVFTAYFSDANYRYEFNEDGQAGVIIAKSGSPDIVILMPQQKLAMTASAEDPMSMGNDPIKSYEHYQKDGTLKEIGKENINGIECAKSELWNISGDEYGKVTQKMFTIWKSDKYKFPIKMINHIDGSEGSGMELKDIKPWTPDANSFSVPEGYQVMEMGGMK